VDLPATDGKANPYSIVIGQVIGIYIADEVIIDGKVDLTSARAIARLGGLDQYTSVDHVFKMKRPG